jgi:MoaA/NifB/PqqE/SkfB family radical SAM enzyme
MLNNSLFRMLFYRMISARWHAGQTAYPILSKIDRVLERCSSPHRAAGLVEESKSELYTRLSARFASPLAQALTLKTLNLCLARYHLRNRHGSVVSRPFGLVVDPSNACKLVCPGCVHSSRAADLKLFDWPGGTLPEERLAALLTLYGPYTIGAYFCNYGEPLLNLNTPALIRLAKSYLIWTALSTSLCVPRFDAEAYVRSGLDFMVLSIDGATQPVYERFRRNGDLELVFGNLRKLVNARRKLKRRTPVLSWNFLAFEHNVHEIPFATRMARKLGVDQFRVVNPHDVSWDDPAVRPAAVTTGVRRLNWRSTASRLENWNPFPDSLQAEAIRRAFECPWRAPSETGSPGGSAHTCHWLYKNIVMDARGRILPCCGGPTPDDRLRFATLGSDIGDPFNSERYLQARAWFAGRTVPPDGGPHCTRCEWDQTTVNIGAAEVRRYFRTIDPSFYDRESLRILSDW